VPGAAPRNEAGRKERMLPGAYETSLGGAFMF